ncbi:bifunctional precorrin-2 dehydrogenase/sirohydrochlorin ferrochelatase [Thermus sp.]|uniref:precorrin-2 dehydrogenase/sirohydrochlorin ferrochelatase family protein n=1 Tax=Thermus sp. TaxID=275 RepID=UPI00307E563F
MGYFPLMLDLKGRPVLLVAGGAETEAKLQALLEAGARLTVLWPGEDRWGLAEKEEAGLLCWLRRSYQEGDLKGQFLAVSLDRALNPLLRREAEAHGVFLVAVDDPQNASAILPAVLRRGPLIAALSTSGAAPALAVRLKERLALLLPEGLGTLVAYLHTLRPRIAQIPSFEERKRLWYRIADLALEELDLDPKEGAEKARRRIETLLAEVAPWTR